MLPALEELMPAISNVRFLREEILIPPSLRLLGRRCLRVGESSDAIALAFFAQHQFPANEFPQSLQMKAILGQTRPGIEKEEKKGRGGGVWEANTRKKETIASCQPFISVRARRETVRPERREDTCSVLSP